MSNLRSRDGVEKIFPRPSRLENLGARGERDDLSLVFGEVPGRVVHRCHADFGGFGERAGHLFLGHECVAHRGGDQAIHRIVERVGAELRLAARDVVMVGILRDLRVGRADDDLFAFFVFHGERTKRLEAAAAEHRILVPQEIAFPKALAGDAPVGLAVDRIEDARERPLGFDELDHRVDVAVRIGVDRARAEGPSRKLEPVEVVFFVAERHPRVAGMHLAE